MSSSQSTLNAFSVLSLLSHATCLRRISSYSLSLATSIELVLTISILRVIFLFWLALALQPELMSQISWLGLSMVTLAYCVKSWLYSLVFGPFLVRFQSAFPVYFIYSTELICPTYHVTSVTNGPRAWLALSELHSRQFCWLKGQLMSHLSRKSFSNCKWSLPHNGHHQHCFCLWFRTPSLRYSSVHVFVVYKISENRSCICSSLHLPWLTGHKINKIMC